MVMKYTELTEKVGSTLQVVSVVVQHYTCDKT